MIAIYKPHFRSAHQHAAFTLLELVLTLAMSVVLMVLIGGAIQFYGRDMNVRDMDVRQTQLAASVMQMIEDDLRSTLHLEPADTAPLEALLVATTGGESSQEPSEDLSAAGIESNDSGLVSEDASATDLTTTASVLQAPGLIGNQYQIQIDVSRLPRLEEYVQMMDENAADLDDIPSDIKTVAYFVQSADMLAGVEDSLSMASQSIASQSTGVAETDMTGGLVRRSLDRSATAYASLTGSLTSLTQTGDVIAPEVLAIEFEYWDGLTWLLEWNSDDYGELPLAVRVRLTMNDVASIEEDSLRIFSHIVRIPLAQPVEEEEDEELAEAGI